MRSPRLRSRPLPFRVAAVLAAAAIGLLGRPPAAAADDVEVAARQILVTWKGAQGSTSTRTKEEALSLARVVRAEATAAGADFTAVAKARSEDRVTGPQGGFLGFLAAEVFDPAFLAAVRSLAVGGVSEPLESVFGFHVVKRVLADEARSLLAGSSAAFIAVRFPYAGLPRVEVKDRTREQAQAAAARGAEALRGGARFQDLPADLKGLPFRGVGFLARVLRKGTALPEYKALEDAVFSTAVGDVGVPVDTLLGWIVFRRVPWFRARVEHLLVSHVRAANVAPAIRRTRDQARTVAEEALARLKADPGAWSKVVLDASDDLSTSKSGGALGVLEPGMHVPELEEAIVRMSPGSIAGVVETRFGFHLLRRVD